MDDEIETVVWDPDSVSTDWIDNGEMFEDFSAPLPGRPSGKKYVLVGEVPKVVGEWIKVEDGLPNPGVYVWVFGRSRYNPSSRVIGCFFRGSYPEAQWLHTDLGEVKNVTHWMSYVEPEPPDDSV